VKRNVVEALGSIGMCLTSSELNGVSKALIIAMEDEDEQTRWQAAFSLAQISKNISNKDIILSLEQACDDTNRYARGNVSKCEFYVQ
jgi:hypothetical protein